MATNVFDVAAATLTLILGAIAFGMFVRTMQLKSFRLPPWILALLGFSVIAVAMLIPIPLADGFSAQSTTTLGIALALAAATLALTSGAVMILKSVQASRGESFRLPRWIGLAFALSGTGVLTVISIAHLGGVAVPQKATFGVLLALILNLLIPEPQREREPSMPHSL